MAWITLTETDLLTAITGPEINAARNAAKAAGQGDPVPLDIAQVAGLVRGRVAACSRNVLGPEGTIPDELKAYAIDLVVYRLCKRVPGKSLLTDQRASAKDDAEGALEDVARCLLAIVPPTTPAPEGEQAAGSAASLVTSRKRVASRCQLKGL